MASTDELWLVDFGEPYPGEPASFRPALVIGPPATFGPTFPFVIVVPLTTTHRGLSLHVEVDPTSSMTSMSPTGLDRTSYVQCELIRSVSRRRLLQRLGAIDPDTSARVTEIVKTLLGH
jgi:mRNA interferase MazF